MSKAQASKPYVVESNAISAAQPFAVVATFRSFNRVVARYADEAQAKRRCRDMNRISAIA